MHQTASSFRQLIERVCEGSEEAAEELVERYSSHIRAVVRRRLHPGLRSYLDSQDFVQSVWKSVFVGGAKLQELATPGELIALIAQMTSNKIIDEVRRRTKTARYGLPANGISVDIDPATAPNRNDGANTPSQYAIAKERWQRLQRLLEEAPAEVRQVFELRMIGRTYEEIADQLAISERTARRTVARVFSQWSKE